MVRRARQARRRPPRRHGFVKFAAALAITVGATVGLRSPDHVLTTVGLTSAAAFVAAVVLAGLFKACRVAAYLTSALHEVDAMTGVDFENYVAGRLRGAGYRVSMTKVTGDFGVDLIASKGAARIAVQCKRHGRRIGAAAIQQVVAGAVMYGCSATMVVSNQEFTPAAVALARMHSCELVGRARLPRWARGFG